LAGRALSCFPSETDCKTGKEVSCLGEEVIASIGTTAFSIMKFNLTVEMLVPKYFKM
jgi:hypothetical protein